MAEWVLYERQDGKKVVKKELDTAKLSPTDRTQLARAMPADVKYIAQWDLYELRVSSGRRRFRLLFHPHNHGAVVVGLLFTTKDQRQLKTTTWETAVARLTDWVERHTQPEG